MKLTEWFSHETKPIRNGVYQVHRILSDGYFYAYWDGYKWRDDNEYKAPLMFQGRIWRGIAK